MRRWFVCLALGVSVTGAANAQQAEPARDLPLQVAPVQIVPVQNVQVQRIQVAPPQVIQADIAPGIALMPAPGNARLTQSDAVVVGRVIAFEPMDVEATPAPNQGKANYRIAVVQVTEAIYGVKKETQTIRVGFIAPVNGGGANGAIGGGGGIQIQIQPAIQPFPGGRRPYIGQMTLQMGQDGLFMLAKHHKENFYTAPNFNSFVNRQNNPNFDNEVKTAKQLCKVMENPLASLKADDVQDRILAAAVLITRYRTNTTGAAMKQEPINAEESKLILKALAQGNWTVGRFNGNVPGSFELFNQLGVSQKDGYNPTNVRNQQDIVQAMQKWLTDNTDKYVIQKLVADPNAKVVPGNPVDIIPQPGVIRPIRPLPPIKVQPGKIQPGKVQILPAPVPVPLPAPVELERGQILPVAPDAPARRE